MCQIKSNKKIGILLVSLVALVVLSNIVSASPHEKKIIIIDPGHGKLNSNFDPGAHNPYHPESNESYINWLIAEKVIAKCPDGYTFKLTRGAYSTKSTHSDRTKFAKDNKADMFVSIHCNAAEKHGQPGVINPEVWGTQVYYQKKTGKPNAAMANIDLAKQMNDKVANVMLTTTSKWTQYIGGNYFVLRNTYEKMPSILIEVGFITNETDEAKLISSEYQDKVAQAIVDGIVAYVTPKVHSKNWEKPTDTFQPDEAVYVTGNGFPLNEIVKIYIVDNKDWTNGDSIGSDVSGEVEEVKIGPDGDLPLTMIWISIPEESQGKEYDIVVGSYPDGTYDAIDAVYDIIVGNGVFVIKPNGFVQEGNRITHTDLGWTFWAECNNNAYRPKSGEAVLPNKVSDINEAIDILGWDEGGEFMKIDGHDAYCTENVRQYSGISQIYLVDWSQEPCRSEALLMSPPESSGLFSRCDVIDAHYSSIFSSFPDWLNDVAYSGDTSVYFPIDVTMHYRYQDMVFDAMDKSTERGLISKSEAEFSIAYYVPHLSFTSISKNVLVFLKDEGWIEIRYHGDSFFEEDLDVLDEMLRSVKIGWKSEIPTDQRQDMCRLCTIAITPPTTPQQQHTPSSIAPRETVLTTKSSKLKGSTVIPYQATGYKFKVFPLGEVPGNFGAPDFNDFDFLIGAAAFGSDGGCKLQSTVTTSWHTDSEIVLRKSFLLPANASNLRVLVAIDNDVQVLINGVDMSGGLVTHECCPILDEFLFEVPDSILQEGENLLAVRARDRGSESYVDLRVLVGDGDILPASLGHSFWDYVVMFGGGGCDEAGPVGSDGRLIDQLLEANKRITGSIFRGLMGRDITGTTGIRNNDTNGDGEYDVVYADTNDDGNINVLAIDTNYYGLLDVWCFDTNGDGKIDVIERDANDDGTIEAMNIDMNYDGIADVSQRDTDGDGYLDIELSDDDFDATCDNITPMYQPCPPAKTLSEDENEIGGFEVTSAIAGILGVVYLLRRRK